MNLRDRNSYVSVDDTTRILFDAINIKPGTVSIPVSQCLNRITTSDITAKRDIPLFDNSAMDGFLFHKTDIDDNQREYRIKGEIRPEDEKPTAPDKGVSFRIMTGAPLPEGNFIIVPVEETVEENKKVTIKNIPGRNPIRKQGEGYQKNSIVLESGTLIRPYEMGLLIESGNRECDVRKPVKIAVQVTGSEIDEDSDSNGPVLTALASSWPSTEVTRWPVLDDEPEKVVNRMLELKDSADIIVTTGGISAGRHDYILKSIQNNGAELLVRKVRQKPGKPFTVTTLEGTPFFHLPGNPISAVFTAEYYLKRVLFKQLGLDLTRKKAISTSRLSNHRGDKTLFLTGKLGQDEQQRLTVTAEESMRSHLMQLYRGNHAYVKIDPETEIQAGDPVEIIPFHDF